ncbi:hypothetical protein IIA28_15605 [candidate division KSB1 bacterium]|nr:hypothetical protein [candidate division KSB1 bacterium]
MAHFVTSVFQVTHEAVSEYEDQIYSLSIHGHNRPECEDIFLSSGLSDGLSRSCLILNPILRTAA